MKIAMCVPSWPPGYAANGIVTYASYLVPALRDLGHEVFVLTHRNMGDADDPFTIDLRRFAPSGTLWHRTISRLAPDFSFYRETTSRLLYAVKELVNKHDLDVLEMEESFGWSLAVSRLNLLPVVVRLHGPWFLTGQFSDLSPADAQNRRRQEIEGRGIRHAQYVTAPAAQVLTATREHYSLELAASQVIGPPITSVEPSLTWNINKCTPNTILFVGRFDELKGGDLAVRAFAELSARHPQLRFKFAGPDRGVVSPDRRRLHYDEFVRTNIPESIRSRIEFLGALSHSDVMALRTQCFATVFASRYEVVGYTVLEALSLGCPIVATAVGGVPELIKDRRNGLLVPSNDFTAISAACQLLLDNPNLAVQIGREAWRYCRDYHDPQTLAHQTIDVYGKACEAFRLRSGTAGARSFTRSH